MQPAALSLAVALLATPRLATRNQSCWRLGTGNQSYSYRSASTGSTRLARCAGIQLAAAATAAARALDDLEQTLSAIEGEIYQVRNQSSQDQLNYPIKLNNKIAALQGVVESADARPTEQAYSVFRTLSNSLDEQLAKLDAAIKTKLPAANQLLQRQKLDGLKAEAMKTP